MRQIVIRTLRQAGHGGHEIVEAENGADAFTKIAETSPDLVLSDWNMPELNGIDLLAQLRASGSPVPFGFVPSEGHAEMRQRAASGGALFLIAKPSTPHPFDPALTTPGPD